MNYITTNVRLSEEDYLRLKEEAVKRRKSLASVIREKLSKKNTSSYKTGSLITQTRGIARENAKVLGNWESLLALREIRNNS